MQMKVISIIMLELTMDLYVYVVVYVIVNVYAPIVKKITPLL